MSVRPNAVPRASAGRSTALSGAVAEGPARRLAVLAAVLLALLTTAFTPADPRPAPNHTPRAAAPAPAHGHHPDASHPAGAAAPDDAAHQSNVVHRPDPHPGVSADTGDTGRAGTRHEHHPGQP
ncbi:hypothetical protein ACIRFL_22540, partial [Streptomyces sp. NPDC102462]